jgi:hypothetical protein
MKPVGELPLGDPIAEVVEDLSAFSIPLYQQDYNGRPSQHGSGFFVTVGRDHFLVSAAHVLGTATTKNGLFFYSSPNTPRYLRGHRIRSGSPESRDRDLIDIGVLRLTGDPMPPYPAVRKFAMDVSYLKPSYQPRSGKHYVMIGFPATKNRFNSVEQTVPAAPYAHRMQSVPEEEYRVHGVSADTHVVLFLDLKKGFDHSGKLQHFPTLEGMSGSPILVLHDEEREQDSGVFPVAAVFTRYRRQTRALIGTDARFVLEAISRYSTTS